MGPNLASAISDARKECGLSQAALARRAGISASYLSRIEGAAWERGGPWPADGVLRALARALGLSSTELIARRRALQARAAGREVAGHPGRAARRAPYAVSVGPADVDAAACGVVERNPRAGTLRSAQVIDADAPPSPSYLDVVAAALGADPDAMLLRVCAGGRRQGAPARSTAPNVRTRVAFGNPLALDVLIGDHEVFLAVPDRRGHPHLRAGVVIDDPDFVAQLRAWFDESVWDAPCGYADVRPRIDDAFTTIAECLSGAEQDLYPATAGRVGPGPDADERERPGQDVVAVTR